MQKMMVLFLGLRLPERSGCKFDSLRSRNGSSTLSPLTAGNRGLAALEIQSKLKMTWTLAVIMVFGVCWLSGKIRVLTLRMLALLAGFLANGGRLIGGTLVRLIDLVTNGFVLIEWVAIRFLDLVKITLIFAVPAYFRLRRAA